MNSCLDQSELAEWIACWLSRELKMARAAISPDQAFFQYGMDSVHAMMLVGDLEGLLERRLSPTLAWSFPTVEKMASHLAEAALAEPEAKSPGNDDAAILAMLDFLPEDEIDRLLAEKLNSKKE
jgi:acyl carrier protein